MDESGITVFLSFYIPTAGKVSSYHPAWVACGYMIASINFQSANLLSSTSFKTA